MATGDQVPKLELPLEALSEAFRFLKVLLSEDKPVDADLAIIDRMSDAVDDCLGGLSEAKSAVRQAQNASLGSEELARCHRQFVEVVRRFGSDLLSWANAAEIERLGRRKGREWPSWAGELRQAMDRCRTALDAVNESILRCWLDVSRSIGVRTERDLADLEFARRPR